MLTHVFWTQVLLGLRCPRMTQEVNSRCRRSYIATHHAFPIIDPHTWGLPRTRPDQLRVDCTKIHSGRYHRAAIFPSFAGTSLYRTQNAEAPVLSR
jgi:hypothetical protein